MSTQNDPRTTAGAIAVLNIATQPGVRLERMDYVNIQIALETVDAALNRLAEFEKPKPAPEQEAKQA